MTRISRHMALAVLAGVIGVASVAAAQTPRSATEPTSQEPHHGMKLDGRSGMMMPSGDTAQMRQVIEGCNRMMGAMLDNAPKPAPAPEPERKPKG